jgi:cell division protein FtsI (penicillin-binding protein 3)
MKKKSRLRTQKRKQGRWVVLYLVIFVVLGAVGHQLEQHYGITTYIKEVLHTIKETFSQSGQARGTFYDRNLKQLAVTLERVSVYIRTREIDSIQETATQLSKVLGLDRDKLEDQLEGGGLRLWIATDISQEQEVSLKKLHLPGVYLQKDEKRYYPNNSQAAHLVGYVESGIGLSGVEFYYDRLLASRAIKKQEEKQPIGNVLDLVLTIDLKIQDILESIAKDIALSEQVEKVSAYLLDSGTGEIIGGANLPGFNPNTFTEYSPEKMENMFFMPLCIPAKFRIFLRDAIMLHAQGVNGVSLSSWSLVPDDNDLVSQLRLWKWLALGDSLETDFYTQTQSKNTAESQQKMVIPSTTDVSFVPELATPMSILTTFSTLLDKGKKIHPFVVKKILAEKTGKELFSGKKETEERLDDWSDAEGEIIESLFRSQSTQGPSNTYFFRDESLVSVDEGGRRHFLINDLLFVNIPVGKNSLNMLIVVQRPPLGVNADKSEENKNIEEIVGKKVDRISVLQQIAKSVEDVVEPEVDNGGNYQEKNRLTTEFSGNEKVVEEEKQALGVMPNLKGFSLRKSLRLLQGTNLELSIQGTGRVVNQKPRPGTSLKGVTDCMMILEKQENIAPEKLSKGQSRKH